MKHGSFDGVGGNEHNACLLKLKTIICLLEIAKILVMENDFFSLETKPCDIV